MEKPPVRLTRKQLYEAVWEKPISVLAKEWGLSDVGLAKTCRRHGVPKPGLGYWARKRAGYKDKQPPLPPVDLEREIVIHGSRESPRRKNDSQPNATPDGRMVAGKLDEAIVVSDVLLEPLPLVGRTSKSLLAAKPDGQGLVRPGRSDALDVNVAPESVDRAMRILDALLKALPSHDIKVEIRKPEGGGVPWPDQYRGGPAISFPGKTVVHVLGETVVMAIDERVKRELKPRPPVTPRKAYQSPGGYSFPEYEYHPTGVLVLRIRGVDGNRTWKFRADTTTRPLEKQLGSFVCDLRDAAVAIQESRRRQEQREQERRIEEQRRWEEDRRKRREDARRQRLQNDLSGWVQSRQIREFTRAIRAEAEIRGTGTDAGSDLAQWLAWADALADALDPFKRAMPTLSGYFPPGYHDY